MAMGEKTNCPPVNIMERPCNPMSALVVAGFFAPAVKLRVAAVSGIR